MFVREIKTKKAARSKCRRMEISLCQKLRFLNTFIIATQCCRPQLFQIIYSEFQIYEYIDRYNECKARKVISVVYEFFVLQCTVFGF